MTKSSEPHNPHLENHISGHVPMRQLYGAFAVMAASLVFVITAQATGFGRVEKNIGDEIIASRMIMVNDGKNGHIQVSDADTGEVLGNYGVGEGSFIRVSVRSMSYKRIVSHKVEENLPYKLTKSSDGRLSLVDPETGHSIKLNAFGKVAMTSYQSFLD